MAEVVSLFKESEEQKGFYVPDFEVRIEGVNMPGDVLRDVIQLTYKENIKEIDSFEITVNNWSPDTRSLKYIGAETKKTEETEEKEGKLKSPSPLRFCIFEPSKHEVKIFMGYAGKLQLMMTGNFTTMEPNFPGSGASTLNVRGLNVLHRLRGKQYTKAWPNRKDSAIAKEIGKLYDKELHRKRFPLPIKINDNAKNDEPELEYVSQQNQYDIDFLFSRARERGYVVIVQEHKDKNGKEHKQLYFGPSDKETKENEITYELEWGKSLMDFKPTLTTANQIRSVTVNGWNRRKKRLISERVTPKDSRLNLNRDLIEILERCESREEVVVDEPVFTEKQARERALAILEERQKHMVTASGTTVGLPNLRVGKRLIIKNLGQLFNGIYFVTETTHTINDNGYITSFKARRENKAKKTGS